MDWSQSYSATWRIFRVNRKTWADADKLSKVDSVSITKTSDGDLLESGSLETTGDFQTDYYRIVMTAEQGGDIQRVDVATLLFESTGGNIDYGRTAYSVEGRSVLYPASTTAVTTGEYAPAGVDGVSYAANLLRSAINAPVETEGSFTLNENLVHEIGSYVIDAVWDVLNAGGYVMQIDGRGVVHIRPKPTEPSLVLSNLNIGLLANGIDFDADISKVPNRYIVVRDNYMTIASNDDENSEISTVNRGYMVDEVDESPTPVNSETDAEYANRRLREMSVMTDSRSYEREHAPNVYPYSLIRASIDGLTGDLRVVSQNITCGNGITVKEKAEREISLW